MSEATTNWNSDTTGVVLREGEVHAWRVPLNRSEAELLRLRGTLPIEETVRADRFYFERDRDAFIATRGTLRQLLGRYLARAPEAIVFDYGPYGKPNLRRASPGLSLDFNVSHSHGLALMAFSLRRNLGIDVESIRPAVASEEIATRFFSSREVAELQSLPPAMRAEGFFLCWTRKEAYVKAIGDGLQIPLNSFHVSLTPSEPARLESADSERWTLRSLRPGTGFVAALVAEGKDWDLHCWDWIQESKA
jgi:4'-phosphopantetheinyl transferase